MDTNKMNMPTLSFTYYIAGPMVGVEEYNFPAFDEATAKFKEQGFEVINPSDIARKNAYAKNVGVSELSIRDYALPDLLQLIKKATHIYMLNGWQYSKGAKAEHAVAEWLGLTIIYQSKEDLKAYESHNKEWWYSFQSQVFDDIAVLTQKKNQDYTGGDTNSNPFANFDESAEFGVDPLIGLSVRIGDKLQRLKAFCNGGLALTTKGDTVADIFKDLIGYSSIALGMIERKKNRD